MILVLQHSRCSLSHSHIPRHLFVTHSQLTATPQVPSHPLLITYQTSGKVKVHSAPKSKHFKLTNKWCTFVVQSSRVHITRAVLEQFLGFAKYLDGLSHGAPLLKQLCDHILFNPAIWIHTPAKVRESQFKMLS